MLRFSLEFDEKLTARPDVDDADIVTGDAVIATFGGGLNVMVCVVVPVILKTRVLLVEAALPAPD